MSGESLNSRILDYKKIFASTEIQATYQDLVGIVQKLRTQFTKNYKGEYAVANVLHGYIDVTYFYLQNEYLKRKKLKLAIVLNHQHVQLELWLLGQTKGVQVSYWEKLQAIEWVNEKEMPEYSIFETILLSNPDFDNFEKLSKSIRNEFDSLSKEIFNILKEHE